MKLEKLFAVTYVDKRKKTHTNVLNASRLTELYRTLSDMGVTKRSIINVTELDRD